MLIIIIKLRYSELKFAEFTICELLNTQKAICTELLHIFHVRMMMDGSRQWMIISQKTHYKIYI